MELVGYVLAVNDDHIVVVLGGVVAVSLARLLTEWTLLPMLETMAMSGASSSRDAIERFSRTELAPDGEWWYEFSVGLHLQDDRELDVGDRRLDALCVVSRDARGPEWLSRPATRDRREAGWLDGEDVILVEYRSKSEQKGAWSKYGGLDIRRRLFEMDHDANVVAGLLVLERADTDVRPDTQWLFENEIDDYEVIIEVENEYYPSSTI